MKLKKQELILILIMLLACVGFGVWLYRPRTGHTIAVITVNAKEYRRIDLETAPDEQFSILEGTGKPISFEVQGGKIRFVNVTCPDHICEKAGWCENPGDRAVCLPNRTTLVCYDAKDLK